MAELQADSAALTTRRATVTGELATIATRERRLLDALMDGDGTEATAIRGRLREELARRDILTAELARLDTTPTLDAEAIVQDVQARAADLRGLLARHVAQARQVVHVLLEGRLVCQPFDDGREYGYTFTATGTYRRPGVALPEPCNVGGDPGGIRTRDLDLERVASWAWLDDGVSHVSIPESAPRTWARSGPAERAPLALALNAAPGGSLQAQAQPARPSKRSSSLRRDRSGPRPPPAAEGCRGSSRHRAWVHVDGDPRWSMDERKNACRLNDSSRIGYAGLEACGGEGVHELGTRARGDVHGDVDVRGQACGAVNDGSLGAEEVPPSAQRVERATEVRQQLSDRRAGRRHRRRGR